MLTLKFLCKSYHILYKIFYKLEYYVLLLQLI